MIVYQTLLLCQRRHQTSVTSLCNFQYKLKYIHHSGIIELGDSLLENQVELRH